MTIGREEILGPVLPILFHDSEDVALANHAVWGPAARVQSADLVFLLGSSRMAARSRSRSELAVCAAQTGEPEPKPLEDLARIRSGMTAWASLRLPGIRMAAASKQDAPVAEQTCRM